MRLSAEVLGLAEQRPNPLGEREIVLRGLAIPAIEHLGATRDAFDTMDFCDNRISRLENLPRLIRLSSLMLSGNDIESVDPANLLKNAPNLQYLTLSDNRISTLHEVANIGTGCPKLEFLSLVGNPVTRRQHYRLYTIHKIPSLKVLDDTKIKQNERDKAERLSKSAAGASLESDVRSEARNATAKTFVPGQGESAQESFKASFTAEQKEQIRQMVANAKSPDEIERIEASVQRGVFPSAPEGSASPPPLVASGEAAEESQPKKKRRT